ncbi:MAG TPA: NUDIX domain-containing protein [Dehalococcoidia bacterium]|nr:NUDIX domain-containing protein [Dehalococcoidia bacterium]
MVTSAGAATAATPAVAVILVILTVDDDRLKVLLVRRSAEPERGAWALPGGLLPPHEAPENAAGRKLLEETGMRDVFLEQLYTFSDLDSTKPSIAIAYYALVHRDVARLRDSEAWHPAWHDVDDLPELGLRNDRVIAYARERLRAKLEYTNIAYSLLPRHFTLSRLQRVYEAIAGRPLDKRNFRRRMLSLGLVRGIGATTREGAHRPAQLYEFASQTPTVL